MRKVITIFGAFFILTGCYGQISGTHSGYVDSVIIELQKKWPNNRTVNLVFHGHSVPAGYFATPEVQTLNSYPNLVLQKVKENYPTAVVNTIVTAIGGEQSEQGAERFKDEVLNHRPDVLFIDYALNDRSIGLERTKIAWEGMIEDALAYGTKVILLTPTPDLTEDILSDKAPLQIHSEQIRQLAETYKVGLVDSYLLFKEIAKTKDLESFMAQNNHINEKGHQIVANAIMEFLKK
jgi:lysophospholipase L1-like esterase